MVNRFMIIHFIFILAFIGIVNGFAAGSQDGEEEQIVLRLSDANTDEASNRFIEAAIDEFTKRYPNVKVERNSMDSQFYTSTGIFSLFSSGSESPDVFWLQYGDAYTNKLNKAGNILDMEPYLDSPDWEGEGSWRDSFTPGSLRVATTSDGAVLGAPLLNNVYVMMWYNVNIFTELGLTSPKTWDEFLVLCEDLKDAGMIPLLAGNKNSWPLANWASAVLQRSVGTDGFNALFRQTSGAKFSDSGVVRAIELIDELVEKGYFNDDFLAIDYAESEMVFAAGNVGIAPIGDWWAGSINAANPDIQLSFFDTPSIPGGKDPMHRPFAPTGFFVNKNSEYPEMAVELAKSLTSVNTLTSFVKTGFVVNNAKVAAKVSTLGLDEIQLKLNNFASEATGAFGAPDTEFNLQLAQIFFDGLNKVLAGVSTPQEAMNEVQSKADAWAKDQ